MYLKELNDQELMNVNGGMLTLLTIMVVAAKPTAVAVTTVVAATAAYLGYKSVTDK